MAESQLSEVISAAIAEEMATYSAENQELRESLEHALASLRAEDVGWSLLYGSNRDENTGLSLDDAQDASKRIRPYLTAGSLMKRGADIHTGYIWGKGVNISGVDKKGRGRASATQEVFKKNQDSLFSASAHAELQKARYSDGIVIVHADPLRRVRRIPFSEIIDIKVNPDFPEEIWAYERQWQADPARSDLKRLWYYTKEFPGTRRDSIKDKDGKQVPTAAGVAVHKRFNRQVGWTLGTPDAMAALPWYNVYTKIMGYGTTVNEALSRILFKIINPTKKAAQNSAAKVASANVHGGTASMVEGADVQAISTAGKGYDFASTRPVAGMIAAALNVSLMELLSDTSAAGSSYGAAAALSPSVLNWMVFCQTEWAEFYADVFDYYGESPEISFDPIVDPDFYRAVQGITLAAAALSDEEYRAEILDLLNIDGDAKKIPATLAARSQPQIQAASPGQGNQNASAGGADGALKSDQRTDTISNAFTAMQIDDMRSLVERFEAAAASLGSQSQ